jgi:hypothetical protein
LASYVLPWGLSAYKNEDERDLEKAHRVWLGATDGANVVGYGNGEWCVVWAIISPRQGRISGR